MMAWVYETWKPQIPMSIGQLLPQRDIHKHSSMERLGSCSKNSGSKQIILDLSSSGVVDDQPAMILS